MARLTRMPVPLIGILCLQAVLSLRLVWSNTAFNDEALYLWSGHWEAAHLVYGTHIPLFQTFFSGSPIIYPVLGAIVDSYGGLAAARLFSLALMLATTGLLYATTKRLFGVQAGLYGAALFALLGPVSYLGALATYDTMALFFLAFASWLVVRAHGWASEPLLIAGALVLALADATKYPTGLWNPVVVALVILTAGKGGWIRAFARGLRFTLYTCAFIASALIIGGAPYLHALLYSTVIRAASTVPSAAILRHAAVWIGIVVLVALRGVVIAPSVKTRLMCVVLVVAGLLDPLDQARIHTMTSLNKHVAFGAWFTAIAAGYVLAQAVRDSKYAKWRIPVGTAALVAVIGFPQASGFHSAWPNSRPAIAAIRHAMQQSPGPILAEQGVVVNYYLKLPPSRVANTFAFNYPSAVKGKTLSGNAAYVRAIRHHYFGVVEVDYSYPARAGRDQLIAATVRSTAGYHLVADIPWRTARAHHAFLIWRYSRESGGGHSAGRVSSRSSYRIQSHAQGARQ